MENVPKSIGPYPVISFLGRGGQGTVYLVQSPDRHDQLTRAVDEIARALSSGPGWPSSEARRDTAVALAKAVAEYTREDAAEERFAGKVYDVRTGPLAEQAVNRLALEFEVLNRVASPNLLSVRYSDLHKREMVTEYYPRGALAGNLDRFVARPAEALVAFRGLVEAVAALHRADVVHRDIKPENIFVANDGRLVLGDFGIVFVDAQDRTRLTQTFERVGTRDWMPPWAHTGMRVDDVTPAFDVFSLGKVLWSMISGRPLLPFWHWDRPPFDLTQMFPNSPVMRHVNDRILSACVVDDEPKCLRHAVALLERVEEVLELAERHSQPVGDSMWCVVCGTGRYELLWPAKRDRLISIRAQPEPGFSVSASAAFNPEHVLDVRAYACSRCGHLAVFQFPNRSPKQAWSSGNP
jgi:serine/threonine protein kinase